MSDDQDHDLTFNGKVYRWSLEDGGISWVEPSTQMIPPMQIIHRLNRLFLDDHVESLFETWGREELSGFHWFLKTNGGTRVDYDRVGIGFLFDTPDPDAWKPDSPLQVLGYRVGKNGLDEQARREILTNAIHGDLPNVGTPDFMARWGLPGTINRLKTIIAHISTISISGGRPDADYSKAVAEWKADLEWLNQLLKVERLKIRKAKYGF